MISVESSRAQGTIEYLVIIAIVVVISLVVVGLLVSMVGQDTSSVGSTSQDLKLKSSSVSVDSLVASTDGNALIVLSNIVGDRITVKKVTVDGVDHVFGLAGPLVTGGKQTFDLNNVPPCTLGEKKNYTIKISYESVNGITQVVDLGSVGVTCSATANAIGSVIKEGTEVVPGGGTTSTDVTITLTNNESSATGANFQQMITINPTLYAAHEASDLGNIRFYDGVTELYSWCESGCASSGTSAVFWVKLPNGVAANSTATVTMKFLATNVGYDATFAGQAPQLSQTIGAAPTSGLLGYWHLNGDATDASGNSNNGSWSGTETYGAGYNSNQSASFDGGSYIDIANQDTFNFTNSFSVSFWTKNSYGGAAPDWISFMGKGQNSTWQVREHAGVDGIGFQMVGSDIGDLWSTRSVNDGSWHLVHAVYDQSAGYAYIYIDGTLDASSAVSWSIPSNSESVSIGAISGGWDYTGSMQDVAIWNRALTANEISQMYYSGYAAHDNGAQVFNLYDNFAGTSLNTSKWNFITEGSVSNAVSNGITIHNNGSNELGGGIIGYDSATVPFFSEILVTNIVPGSYDAYTMGLWNSSDSSYAYSLGASSLLYLGGAYFGQDTRYWIDGVSGIPSGGNTIVGVGINANNGFVSHLNYLISDHPDASPDSSLQYLGFGVYPWAQNTAISGQWARTRVMPPNEVMPTVGFS